MLQTFRSALTFRRTQHSNFLQVQQVGNDLEDFNDIETDVLDSGPVEIKDDLQVRLLKWAILPHTLLFFRKFLKLWKNCHSKRKI